MSDLVVLEFDGKFKADEVLLTLRKLEKGNLIDLEDACVVVRNDDGKIQIKQTHNLVAGGVAAGATRGGLWGALIGLLFLNPLAGAVIGAGVGAGSGAITGALVDIGINDDFIKELGETVTPGTSALFVLVRRVTPDRVIEEVKPYNPKVLHTSLPAKNEEELRQALEAKQSA